MQPRHNAILQLTIVRNRLMITQTFYIVTVSKILSANGNMITSIVTTPRLLVQYLHSSFYDFALIIR